MKKSQDGDEIGRASKPGQDFSKSFTIDGVESLGQVNEGHESLLVLFLTFLLNLSGHKDHIGVSSRSSKLTLGFRGNIASVSGSRRFRRTRASIFPAMDNRAMSR